MKELATASIRIAGLLLIIFTFSNLPYNAIAYSVRPDYGVLPFALSNGISIAVGLMLCIFPSLISTHLISSAPKRIKLENPRMVLYVGCILIGVFILAHSLSDLVYYATNAFILHESPDFEVNFLTFDFPSVAAAIVELILSLVLIFKSRGIVNLMIGKPK